MLVRVALLTVGLWMSIESVKAFLRWLMRREHSRNCWGSEVSVPTGIATQPGPPTPDVSFQRFTIHKAPVSAGPPNDEKRQTARTFIRELEDRNHADINVWTDGSLITTPKETYQELHLGERVSVIWDEGW